ncbi:MAG: 50S ribosomal protein L35 [Candidatus Jettenia sp.]|uniref:Large ribosomal subunit protein bL35 n=1 Tax=Candidatus Jettenia ecosi TaxID=2494326 RepID=A0A533Q907_9BACT|nr:MAG: LSU ribosomal protein L35p [Candidatus Jettenia ecosi]UJS17571.1 MAG: 50S ribosomal protein L35 [Candidatus Jettenia sp.]
MPKLKTHKGLKKRIKISAKGKVKRPKAGKSHLMSGKPGRKKGHLRKKDEVSPAFSKNMKRALRLR